MSNSPDITVIVSDGLAINYGSDTQPVGTEAAGTSALVSRADHVHAHGNQTGPTLHAIATSSANGFMSASDKAKIDTLTAGSAAVGNVAGAALDATTAAAAGTATTAARSDHTHSIAVAVIGDVQDVGVAATGTSPRFALADHSHAHGEQSDPTDHALADGSNAGFMSAADFTKLSGISAGAIAATSTTPSPVGTAAVGIAATAARADHVHAHGNQLGGALHAVADDSTAGFMSATDKSKLDALPANPASVGSVTPSPIGAAAIGVATTAARSDHVHAHGNQAGGALHAAATDSTAGFMLAADKTKLDDIDVATTVTDVGASGVVGVLTTYAPEDHAHAHGAQTDPTMHALADGSNAGFMSAAEFTKLAGVAVAATATPLAVSPPANVTAGSASTGIGTHAAKDDHVHSVSTAAAVGLDPSSISAAGSAITLARSDHTHAIATAVAVVSVGTANVAGSAATFARGDHVHSHGAQTDGTLHAAVSASVAGFMSAADKIKLNALVAGTDIQEVNTGNDAGTSTTWARSDHVHFHGHLPADGQMHAEVDGTDAGFAPALAGVDGYVLTDNGDGTASWLAATGSGGTPADGSVTTVKIVDGNVTSAKLADGSVTTVKIADANVTTAKIASGAVDSAQLASGSVIAAKIAAGAVGTTQLADANVTAVKIADANVTTVKLADSSVTTVKIADANVTTAKLVDNSVTTAKITDANVTSAKIAAGAVGATQIANGGVGTIQLAANAVTAAKIANATITSTQLATAAVATPNIADGAVTQAKLDSGVTLPLADNSVTTIKIVDANVTTGKLADGLLTEAKLATGLSVPVSTYAKGSLPSPDGKVRLAKLTNYSKGVQYSNGTMWAPIHGLDVFVMEDFGAVADGTTDCLAAWNAIQTAIQSTSGSGTQAGTNGAIIRFANGAGNIYHFSDTPQLSVPCIVEGAGGSYGAPRTLITATAGKKIFQVVRSGNSSIIRNLGFSANDPGGNVNVNGWQASHSYSLGALITPAYVHAIQDTWGGYLFKCTTAGTSDSSEPTWPTCNTIATRTETEGQTINDGSAVWTATQAHGVVVNGGACLFENVQVSSCAGDGFHCYGAVSASDSSQTHFVRCSSYENYSDGFYNAGPDANVSLWEGCSALANYGYGFTEQGQLGSALRDCHARSNGQIPWVKNGGAYSAGLYMGPTQDNGYLYRISTGGTNGSTEPTWPTTVGATVSSGTITYTCMRAYSGGAYRPRNTRLDACYAEADQQPIVLGVGSVWIGGANGPGFAPDSSVNGGFYINSRGQFNSHAAISDNGDGQPITSWLGSKNSQKRGLSLELTDTASNTQVAGSDLALIWHSGDSFYNGWRTKIGSENGILIADGTESGTAAGQIQFPNGHWLGGPNGSQNGSFQNVQSSSSTPTGGQHGDEFVYAGNTVGSARWHHTGTNGWVPYGQAGAGPRRDVTDGVGAPYAMVAADHNCLISNQGASAKVYITLPDNSAVGYSSGQFFRAIIAVQDTDGIRVKAQNPQTITLGGYAPGAAAGYIESTQIGAYVVLCSLNGTEWYAESIHGQWNVDGAAPALRSTGVEALVSSTVVDLSLSTKQTLFTVPSGRHLIVTKIFTRSPTTTITTAMGGVGYNANADDIIASVDSPTTVNTFADSGAPTNGPIGAPADVFGYKTSATQASTSMTIDVFGYFF